VVEIGSVRGVEGREIHALIITVQGFAYPQVVPEQSFVAQPHAGIQSAIGFADHDVGGFHFIEEGAETPEVVPAMQVEGGFEVDRCPGAQVGPE
jgi:hypothetical protein